MMAEKSDMTPLQKKSKLVLCSVFAASILAISLVALAPSSAFAEMGKHHNIPEISGSIQATDDMGENMKLAEISFVDAATTAEASVSDGKVLKGKLGVVQGFLVYKFAVIGSDELVRKVIVDAGNTDVIYISDGKTIDEIKKYHSSDKWSHYKHMKGHYSDMTPEEKEQKMAQYREVKEAFSQISEEDQQTIKTHFKEMKTQWKELSAEERNLKHAEFKTMMQEFMALSLDDKVAKLTEFADSLSSN